MLLTLLNRHSNSQRILECRYLLKALGHGISFQRIPAHCEILKNEKVYVPAKKGVLTEQRINRLYPFNKIKLFVNLTLRKILSHNTIQSVGNKRWKVLRIDKSIIHCYPRKIALLRGLTGQDCLQDHQSGGLPELCFL